VGKHGKLIAHPQYATLYERIVHAFYRQHNLPHDPEKALQGLPLLAQYQPSLESLT
jgi:hypothetical protein